jgi:hypothetical protein
LVDVVLASFSSVQVLLACGAAYIAFTLRKTFEGGIFENAWRTIGMSPLIYAAGQLIELFEVVYLDTPLTETLDSLVEVAFLLILVYGLFRFASAWRPSRDPETRVSRDEPGCWSRQIVRVC